MSKTKSRFDLGRLFNRKHRSVSLISYEREAGSHSGTDDSTAELGSVNQNKNVDNKLSENHTTRAPPDVIDNPSVVASSDASIDPAPPGPTAPADIKSNCMSFYLNAHNVFSG